MSKRYSSHGAHLSVRHPEPQRIADRFAVKTLFFVLSAVLICTLAVFWVHASSLNSGPVQQSLESAYHDAKAPAALSYPSPQAAVARIAAKHPQWRVEYAGESGAYSYLRHHSGQTMIFVSKGSTREQIVLLGRDQSADSAIGKISGTVYTYDFKRLWTGSLNWGGFAEAGGLEGLLGLLLFVSFIDVDRKRRLNFRVEQKRQAETLLTEWRRLVPADGLYGPLAPVRGFDLYVPEFEEHDLSAGKRATFHAVHWGWNGNYWHQTPSAWDDYKDRAAEHRRLLAAKPRLKDARDRSDLKQLRAWQPPAPLGSTPAPALKSEDVPEGVGPAQLGELWFDFCKRVADYNASTWAATQRKQEAKKEEQRQWQEATALAAEHARQLDLERGKLADLLQPGHELMRGLGSEQSL